MIKWSAKWEIIIFSRLATSRWVWSRIFFSLVYIWSCWMSAKDEISVKISWCSKKEKSFSPTFFFVALVFPASRLLTILLGQKREREIKNFHQLLNRGCKIRRNRAKDHNLLRTYIQWWKKERNLWNNQMLVVPFCALDSIPPALTNDVQAWYKRKEQICFLAQRQA